MDLKKLESCIQLVRKLPPGKLEQNINAISNLIYEEDDLLNAFLQKIENPIVISSDDSLGEFIKCEYNRDGDSYRSPHSNLYFPEAESGAKFPSPELRELEIKLNKIFSIYSRAYYSNTAISSVYLWEIGEEIKDGFVVVVLIKNEVKDKKKIDSGIWDSTNFVQVTFKHGENNSLIAEYKLTTTISLMMNFEHRICGKVTLSGGVTKQMIREIPIKTHLDEHTHVESIGNLIEDMENNLRNVMEEIYIKKSKEIIDTARFSPVEGKPNMEQASKIKEMFHGK
jgi:capping protein beta